MKEKKENSFWKNHISGIIITVLAFTGVGIYRGLNSPSDFISIVIGSALAGLVIGLGFNIILYFYRIVKKNIKNKDYTNKTNIITLIVVVLIIALIVWGINSIGEGNPLYYDEDISIEYPSYLLPYEDPVGVANVVFGSEEDPFVYVIVLFADYEGDSLESIVDRDLRDQGITNTKGVYEEGNEVVYTYDQDPITLGLEQGDPIPMKIRRKSIAFEEGFVQIRYLSLEENYDFYLTDVNKMIDSLIIK